MKKNFVVISGAAAVLFALIACLGDSNEVVYSLFMGLCCAAFCLYVGGLLVLGYAKEKPARTKVKAAVQNRKAA